MAIERKGTRAEKHDDADNEQPQHSQE